MTRKFIVLAIVVCMILSTGISSALSATTEPLVTTAAASTFTDVPASFWANNVIVELTNRGVLSGYKDGSFRPNAMVTRAEFAKMITLFMKVPVYEVNRSSFNDVDVDLWACKYIEAGLLQELLTGYPDGTFKPMNNIKRSEVATILVAANNTLNKRKSAAITTHKPFSDVPGNWAENNINTMRSLGILDAYPDGLFRPERTCSRAEAAKMLYLFLQNVLGIQITPTTPASSSGETSGGGGTPNPEPEPTPTGCLDEGYRSPMVGDNYLAMRAYSDNENDQSFSIEDGKYKGTKINVKPGTIDSSMGTVSIGINYEENLPGTPLAGKKASDVIVIEKDNRCNFNKPIEVTIPYKMSIRDDGFNEFDIPSVFYWDPCAKKYIAVGIKDIDQFYNTGEASIFDPHGTITFKTVHGGKFVALADPGLKAKAFGWNTTYSVATGFNAAEGGFEMPAFGTDQNPNKATFAFGEPSAYGTGGTSLGMSNYAIWHNVYDKVGLRNALGEKMDIERELIARAFLASSNSWSLHWDFLIDGNPIGLTDEETLYQLVQTMIITGDPQLVYASEEVIIQTGYQAQFVSSNPWDTRALVVYAYDKYDNDSRIGDRFSVYDPIVEESGGDSDETHYLYCEDGLQYVQSDGGTEFNEFEFDGLSSIFKPSQFSTLYDGSLGTEGGFLDRRFGTISDININDVPVAKNGTVTSFATSIKITGKVTSEENPALSKFKYITCNIDGVDGLDGHVVDVKTDGTFEFDLTGMDYKQSGQPYSIMLYSTFDACPTLRRCAQPDAAFAEIFYRNDE